MPRPPKPPSLESLITEFREIPDPRVDRTRAHPLVNILTIALLGAISGADGWEALEHFARIRADVLRRFLSIPKGTPSADTFRRVFEALDPGAFQDAFRRWLKPVLENLEGQTIALDGKALRGAMAHAAGQGGAFHLMHVWVVEQQLLLGQKAVTGAPGEVAAAIEMLKVLDLSGATVTADANSCTADVTAAVRSAGADYILALKGNRSALHTFVQERFAEAQQAAYPGQEVAESRGDAHGRSEVRIVRAMPLGDLPKSMKAQWVDLHTIVQVDRLRTTDHVSFERSYYITSHDADPVALAARIRDHWSIENQLHHCLDVSFNEDRRRIRDENGAQNFALITRYALSILKRVPTKMSIAMKRRVAAWGDSYFLETLAHGIPQV